ncbi:hypothetical protein HDE_05631 [Halotydeus destructor]|nr:hypothetical protein HDE_05631 [Halotydeus destructor]
MDSNVRNVLLWLAVTLLAQLSFEFNVDSSLTSGPSSSSISATGNDDRCNRTLDIYRTMMQPIVTDENRGRPLTCTYKLRIRPSRDDWVVFIRFTKFRLGQVSPDRKECFGGFIQIIDGYKDSNISKRANPGFFCGEIDMPKTYISETPHVKLILHVDSYDEETYFQFDTSVERQNEFYQRLGQYHQLHSNRKGKPVLDTYCDRIFENCSPGHCYAQSPGFPEVYPRNLRCRYLLISKKSLIGMELISLDVDGQECDSLLMCFPRPVTINPIECPHDYVRIYDGRDEASPVIATLCGRGRLPSNIIASGPAVLVEFVSSPAGHLINSGFQLKADNIFEPTDSQAIEYDPTGTCVLKKQLVEVNGSNTYTNVRSWYPARTTCSYIFTSIEATDRISLQFLWFRLDRVTLCDENIRIFDGLEPDPKKLMNRLCDTNKPMFYSTSGSFAGSSINYGFEVRRVLVDKSKFDSTSGRGNNCSEQVVPHEDMSTDSFTLIQHQLDSLDSSGSVPIYLRTFVLTVASMFLVHFIPLLTYIRW